MHMNIHQSNDRKYLKGIAKEGIMHLFIKKEIQIDERYLNEKIH